MAFPYKLIFAGYKLIPLTIALVIILVIIIGVAVDFFAAQDARVSLDNLWKILKEDSAALISFDVSKSYAMLQIYGNADCSNRLSSLSSSDSVIADDYSLTCTDRYCLCMTKLSNIPDIQQGDLQVVFSGWDLRDNYDVRDKKSNDIFFTSYYYDGADFAQVAGDSCAQFLTESRIEILYCRPLKTDEYIQKPTLENDPREKDTATLMMLVYGRFGINADEIISENLGDGVLDLRFRFGTVGGE